MRLVRVRVHIARKEAQDKTALKSEDGTGIDGRDIQGKETLPIQALNGVRLDRVWIFMGGKNVAAILDEPDT